MFLVYTRYTPGIYQVYAFRLILVSYTRARYIPGIYQVWKYMGIYQVYLVTVYTSYIANMVLRRGYTRYIPGKCHFYRIQMGASD